MGAFLYEKEEKKMKAFKTVFISLGTAVSSFLGVLFVPILIMVACNTLDFITGMISSWMKGDSITSKAFYRGVVKKVCMWLLVIVGVLIDETIAYSLQQFGIELPFSFLIACVVAVWIICNEFLSILENMTQIGVPMPAFLKKLVRYLQHQTEAKVVIPDMEPETKEGEGDAES